MSGALTESERHPGVTFIGWYCADTTLTVAQKIAAASARHAEKFGQPANLCLCSPADASSAGDIVGVRIEARGYIARNTFYVGAEGGSA